MSVTKREVDGVAYREALPKGWDGSGPVALAVHGFPTSSYLWRAVLPKAAEAGYRALAPDLPAFGDTPPHRPGTWERQVENVERFRRALGLDRVALMVHDWGGLIGLRWACDHPDAVSALVIADTGFFPDGKWHGMANTLRTEGEGEQLVDAINRDLLAVTLRQISPSLPDDAVDEYAKAFADADRRVSHLEMYRSGDFPKLKSYRGKLAALGVPTLILWGEKDQFAPVAGAYRFQKEIPHARVVVLEGVGHYLMEDEPARVGDEVRAFLAECGDGATE